MTTALGKAPPALPGEPPMRPLALIVPHAGYPYSGPVAARTGLQQRRRVCHAAGRLTSESHMTNEPEKDDSQSQDEWEIYLQALSLGLGTVAVGAFDDERVKKTLLMQKEEYPLYIMPVGRLR